MPVVVYETNPYLALLSDLSGLGPQPPTGADWWAAYPDDSTYEMLAQRAGVGEPTFTHSGLLLPDNEGVYRDIPANTAPCLSFASYKPLSSHGHPLSASFSLLSIPCHPLALPCLLLSLSSSASLSVPPPASVSIFFSLPAYLSVCASFERKTARE